MKQDLIFLQVLEVDSGEVKLTYMTHLKQNLYKWPAKEDVSWEDAENIRKILSQPSISGTSTNDRLNHEFTNL